MTELSCHCEGAERPWQSQGCEAETCNRKTESIAKSLDNNAITTSCATPRNVKNLSCLSDVLTEGAQDKILKQVQDDKYVSEAHRKELNVLTSYRLNDFKKKAAFTLAEVLITLAIIGVVAAMTIPTIAHNIQHAVLKNQFKKTYSIFRQAIFGIQTERGIPVKCFYWERGGRPFECSATCDEGKINEYGECTLYHCAETGESLPSNYNGEMSECKYLNNELFFNRLKVVKYCENNAVVNGCIPEEYKGYNELEKNQNTNMNPDGLMSGNKIRNSYPAFVLTDGTIIMKGTGLNTALFIFDINGAKGPNKWGYDMYSIVTEGTSRNGITGFRNQQDNLKDKGGLNFEEMLKEIGLK